MSSDATPDLLGIIDRKKEEREEKKNMRLETAVASSHIYTTHV